MEEAMGVVKSEYRYEFKYDTWDIFLSSLNLHASIDLCTRVPKNCKYTELELYSTVYVYGCLLCVTYTMLSAQFLI